MAERKVLFDSINIGFMNEDRTAQSATSFGALALAEMPATGLIAKNLAAGSDLESLGHRFLCFDTFRTSHKLCFFTKELVV